MKFSREELERASAIFRAAGDPERLAMLDALSDGERCVSSLAALTGAGMSTVSQRLKLLRDEGLITRRRDGRRIFYTLADDHITELVRSALAHARCH